MKEKKKSERLVVQMDADFKRQLDNRSKLTGVPISEFVRRALAEALKKKP
jgi:post-segregation antitoxin (ccd killing protein)